MTYAKLQNGIPVPARPILIPGTATFYTPTDEQLRKAGYLPIQPVSSLKPNDGKSYTLKWVQTEDAIVQQWVEVPKRQSRFGFASNPIIQFVDDATALKMKSLYPTFESVVGQEVEEGFKFVYNGKLYKVTQAKLLLQENRKPGPGAEALYVEIHE